MHIMWRLSIISTLLCMQNICAMFNVFKLSVYLLIVNFTLIIVLIMDYLLLFKLYIYRVFIYVGQFNFFIAFRRRGSALKHWQMRRSEMTPRRFRVQIVRWVGRSLLSVF